jgi:ribose transport system substrate-binding protein
MRGTKWFPPALAFLLAAALAAGQTPDPYRAFNKFRAIAASGKPYPGAPLRGKVIGFANIAGTWPFCISVENSIRRQLALAGLDVARGLIVLDNMGDSETGLRNAEIMLARKPHLFIEFQVDPLVNNIVASRFAAAGIPVVAIDVPVPGAPFIGVDNFGVALLCGRVMAGLIREKWGGWHGVDAVFLGQAPRIGDVAMLRSEGVAHALAEEFGISPTDPKIIRFDFVPEAPEESGWGFSEVLAADPVPTRIAAAAINEIFMAGIITALQSAGRWSAEDSIIVTMGMDEIGQAQLREGLSDAGIAFLPERYGEYIVPAVCAILTGNAVPSHVFVRNEVITQANLDRWYPRKR